MSSATGYTTLEHLKRSLNNGELPVMMPVAEKAKAFIDPAFVLGQGGLQEDERRGLRCPVKGCGGHYHSLAHHWRLKHRRTIGPLAVLRVALGLHPTRALSSKASQVRRSSASKAKSNQFWKARKPMAGVPLTAEKLEGRRLAAEAIEVRNLRNQCDAQMRKRYFDARDRVGREPTLADLGGSFRHAVDRHYGSINAFRATVGIEPIYNYVCADSDVLAALEAWHKAHGRLPTTEEVRERDRTPYLPTRDTILRVFGVSAWAVAMSHVAWLLGIDDPMYSPKSKEAA